MAHGGIAKGFGDLSLVGDDGRSRAAGHAGQIAAAAADKLTAADNACGYSTRLRTSSDAPQFLE